MELGWKNCRQERFSLKTFMDTRVIDLKLEVIDVGGTLNYRSSYISRSLSVDGVKIKH